MKIWEEHGQWEPLGVLSTHCCITHLFIYSQSVCFYSKHNINLFMGCKRGDSSGASTDLATLQLCFSRDAWGTNDGFSTRSISWERNLCFQKDSCRQNPAYENPLQKRHLVETFFVCAQGYRVLHHVKTILQFVYICVYQGVVSQSPWVWSSCSTKKSKNNGP